MRKVFEALRLTFDQDRSQREIATILALSQSTVHDYVVRFRATGLPWPLPVEIDEAVRAAYGWEDLSLDHGHYDTRQGTRWTV